MNEDINDLSNLIYSIARSFTSDQNLINDLYQQAVIGIINARKNYDINSSCKFSTYARMYIYGEIFKYFNADKTIKRDKETLKLYKLILKTYDLLSQELKKEPTTYEIASYLNMEESKVSEIIKMMMTSLSLEEENSDGFSIESRFKTYDNYSSIFLSELLESLNEEEKKLIKLRYIEGYSQDETAKILSMSQSGVSRLEKEAISKMRVRSK